ncbi:MAG: TrbI/VirB10 family protein [Proteobacteria bacterium]|nr:TrbI/VirB10 family protein [Pseudomonadota bacterium]
MSGAAPPLVSEAAPDVAIRARPPSPKRLSRKVLLSGALVAGAIITIAVVGGLSAGPPHGRAREEATANAGGPPESIAQASSQYDASNLVREHLDAAPPADLQPSQLAPPQDPAWSNPTQGVSTANAATAHPTPDPEAAARSSPILFVQASRAPAPSAAPATSDARLDASLTPPRSQYEIQAGNVIPAALVTGLNSDLAGRVIAQVTAPVYDSVTGAHLLIPQGARLLGTYDNGVRYGDERILLTWNRLILPNGWSIDLQQMAGADPEGAAGLVDKTDNHLWRLGGAVGLSAIISVIANNSQNDRRTQSLSQSLGDAAAQQAAQTGGRIVDRELSVHPTLRVRPGANVRVLVTRDIALRPYREAGGGDAGVRTP